MTHSYTWGLDLSGTLQGAGGVGGLLSQTVIEPSSVKRYFPLADANGNCVSFIDEAGNMQAHYTYDAFGNTVSQTGAVAADFRFRFRFSSKYLDDETGLLYYGYRYYAPALGRWLSRDPIGIKGGNGLYRLVDNCPISLLDLLGQKRYGLPADPEKCDKLAKIMAINAVAAGPTSYMLWMRWLENKGGSEELSMDQFDNTGACRATASAVIALSRASQRMFSPQEFPKECGESIVYTDEGTVPCVSLNMMILNHTIFWRYSDLITKNCDEYGCCKTMDSSLSITFRAFDRTDFNPGGSFLVLGGEVEEDLVNECFELPNSDFNVYAVTTKNSHSSRRCKDGE